MGRAPCCSKVGLHKGPWTTREDTLLTNYIHTHGEGEWRQLPQKAGLLRCGKSCRLRWMNYLRPDIKRGNIGQEEEDLIIRLHSLLGNRWSLIAGRLPGRTDNEIKNYWNTHLCKKLKSMGVQVRQAEPRPVQRRASKKKTSKNKTKNSGKVIEQGDHDDTMVIHTTPTIHCPKPTRLVLVHPAKPSPTEESSDWMDQESETSSPSFGQQDRRESSMENFHIHSGAGDLEVDQIQEQDYEFPLIDESLFDSIYQGYSQLLHSDEDYLHTDPFEISETLLAW